MDTIMHTRTGLNRQHWLRTLAATLAGAMLAIPAAAFDISKGPIEGNLDMSMSAGLLWRAQDRDNRIVGKRNVDGNLCSNDALLGTGCLDDKSERAFQNANGSFAPNVDNGNLNYDKGDLAYASFKIVSDLSLKWNDFGMFSRAITVYDPENEGRAVYHPHNFSETNPDGTQVYASGLQPAYTQRSKEQEDSVGFSAEIKDLYVYGDFEIFDRFLSVKLGRQIVSWGEQLIFVPNSLNSINVPNVVRLHTPGLDLKELFDPVELAYMSYELSASTSIEAFYQLKWRPIEIDPRDSFFSTVDVAGAGASYAMLSFGRSTEDPDNIADSVDYGNNSSATPGFTAGGPEGTVQELSGRGCLNPDSVAADAALGVDRQGNGNRTHFSSTGLRVTGGRTLCRAPDREPDDDGQFGASIKYFAEWLNDSEIGLYYMNYHSRFPLVGFYATDANAGYDGFGSPVASGGARLVGGLVAANATTVAAVNGQALNSNIEADIETLFGAFNYADTATLVIEYPENLNLYGFSFNTTVGDFSVSGEYAYHKNRPLQLDGTDLTYFAEAPAFGTLRRRNPNAGPLVNGPVGFNGGMVPSFVELYRGGLEGDPTDPDYYTNPGGRDSREAPANDCPTAVYEDIGVSRVGQPTNICPGQYIPGYERFPVGQGDIVLLEALSQNPFFADQWIRVFEFGFTKVFGMPGYEVDEFGQPVSGLLFSGSGVSTHPTLGRNDVFGPDPDGDGTSEGSAHASGNYRSQNLIPGFLAAANDENVSTSALIQNPRRGNEGRPSSFSWGIRQLNLLTYNNLFWGLNFKPLIGFFWDINGISPGPGGNHIEGRKLILAGTDIEKGNFGGGFRYTWSTGGGVYNQERDRDNFQVSVRYQF